MIATYRNNHYVPKWYQKRFILSNHSQQSLYYLDLKNQTFTDSRGVIHNKKPYFWGTQQCFSQKDLYTTNFLGSISTKIERLFFGTVDVKGKAGVEYFTNFSHPSANGEAFHNLILFMSTQKLRTPKGLNWLMQQINFNDHNVILARMLEFRQLFCAIWTECIWLIADAACSDTKFIVSDHPVTVYNRACGPRSDWCRGSHDPDIWLQATQTLFPLSLDKILILTALPPKNPTVAK